MNAKKAKALRRAIKLMREEKRLKPTSYAIAADRGQMVFAKGERMAYKQLKKVMR